MTTYSNPRTEAAIENWPSGSKRVTARFAIESDPKRGERAVRVTTGKPVTITYSTKARIIDGDDGRTYIARLTQFGHISIFNGDMKYEHETVFPGDARYGELAELFQ